MVGTNRGGIFLPFSGGGGAKHYFLHGSEGGGRIFLYRSGGGASIFMARYITKLVVDSPVPGRVGDEVYLLASGGGGAFFWCTKGGTFFFRRWTLFL